MRILILGIDGYLGWPTALRMIAKDHQVYGMDDFSKRLQLRKNNVTSAFKIKVMKQRISHLKKFQKNVPKFFGGTKKQYDPKIVFDPNCLGNHWEILR